MSTLPATSAVPSPNGLPLPNQAVLEVLAERAQPSQSLEELDRRVDEWRLLSGDKLPFDAAVFCAR